MEEWGMLRGIVLALTFVSATLLPGPTEARVRKPVFRPIPGEASAPGTDDEAADGTRYFEDLPGVTVSGVPRIVRDNNGTEIFFTNLNQSYFIRQDNFHNRRYYPFEAAMKSGASISFRADPVSRQVLEVDGVDQASAKTKPRPPASTTTSPAQQPGSK